MRALEAGELLIAAKKKVNKHGEWMPWVKANYKFPERKARFYMQLAREWPELSKTATAADLTLGGARRLLSGPTAQELTEDYQTPSPKKARKTTHKIDLKDVQSVIETLQTIEIQLAEIIEKERSANRDHGLVKLKAKFYGLLDIVENAIRFGSCDRKAIRVIKGSRRMHQATQFASRRGSTMNIRRKRRISEQKYRQVLALAAGQEL